MRVINLSCRNQVFSINQVPYIQYTVEKKNNFKITIRNWFQGDPPPLGIVKDHIKKKLHSLTQLDLAQLEHMRPKKCICPQAIHSNYQVPHNT